MKLFFYPKLALLALASYIALYAEPLLASTIQQTPIERIAFGSCADPQESLAIFDTITQENPDIFVFLGDNVYAEDESDDPLLGSLTEAYDTLGNSPAFQRLSAKIPLYATWDDHDYGKNDGGSEYKHKRLTQKIFMDFWDVTSNDPRRSREGTYFSKDYIIEKNKIKVIGLDTRYFRSNLLGSRTNRQPNNDPKSSILGITQWP